MTKQILKDLSEDDGDELSSCQVALLDLALPIAIAVPDVEDDEGYAYVRADKARWSDLLAGGNVRDRNAERVQAKR